MLKNPLFTHSKLCTNRQKRKTTDKNVYFRRIEKKNKTIKIRAPIQKLCMGIQTTYICIAIKFLFDIHTYILSVTKRWDRQISQEINFRKKKKMN